MHEAIRRSIIVGFSILIQVIFTLLVVTFFYQQYLIIRVLLTVAAIFIVLNITNNSKSLSKDMPSILLILISPILGTMLYLFISNNIMTDKTLRHIVESENHSKQYYIKDEELTEKIKNEHNTQLLYFNEFLNYPVSERNKVKYYPTGEDFFPEYLEELKKAEKFIFLEYFILNAEGKMWPKILEILVEKVKQGVEVRVIYDGFGCISTLKSNYYKYLESLGIKCLVFNDVRVFKGFFMNNRDHRKITVIDGKVAFSGGLNFADEYINENSRFGYWKDNGIMIKGEGIANMTVLFLTIWNAYRKEDTDYLKYRYEFKDEYSKNGYLCAYGSSPVNNVLEGEDVYLNIINQAKEYVYMMTPYLVIDTDMINAIISAKRRGVDVRIIIPGIPDKKVVYMLTKSYAKTLIDEGVQVYTYTPGFVHAKVFVSDHHIATVGTINLDYRSLYLHFENGIYLQEVDEISKINQDVIDTMNQSKLISLKDVEYGLVKQLWQALLRLLAPFF